MTFHVTFSCLCSRCMRNHPFCFHCISCVVIYFFSLIVSFSPLTDVQVIFCSLSLGHLIRSQVGEVSNDDDDDDEEPTNSVEQGSHREHVQGHTCTGGGKSGFELSTSQEAKFVESRLGCQLVVCPRSLPAM